MKNGILGAVFAVCLLAISTISCSKDNNIVKERTNLLFDLMASGNMDSIISIYPDFDDTYMVIESDSFKISKVEDNNEEGYDVEVTNYYSEDHMPDFMIKKNIILTFVKNRDGEYYIKKSVGLLNSDSMPVEAIETGYLKVRSNDIDVDVIKGLDVLDIIREESLLAKYERIKQDIKVELWYRTGSRAINYYRVYNNSNEDINLITFAGTYTYETYPGYEFHNKGVARYLRRNSYIDVHFSDDEFVEERLNRGTIFSHAVYVNHYHLKSYEIIDIELANKEIIYQGNEYANYIKKHPKTQAKSEEKTKEEEYLSLLEEYVNVVEGLYSLEGIYNMPKVNKKYSLKAEYLFGVKGGVNYENSDLKMTNEHKERYNQLKKRYESAYKRLEETFVKE